MSRARDLGLTLISVKRIDEEEDIESQTLKGTDSDPIENSESTEDT
jgi:hypothetical protein